MQIHVLCVPGKARLPAAKVEVGRVHAADLDPVVLINIKKTGDKKAAFRIRCPNLQTKFSRKQSQSARFQSLGVLGLFS